MSTTLKLLRREERGFTLIELLVVVLILGLLAALAMPAFLDQRDKAHDGQAKQAARTAYTAMEACGLQLGGYESCNVEALQAIEITLPAHPDLKANGLSSTGYTIIVRSSGLSSRTFRVKKNANGKVKFVCTDKGVAGCPASGTWN